MKKNTSFNTSKEDVILAIKNKDENSKKYIGEILLDYNFISESMLQEVLDEQQKYKNINQKPPRLGALLLVKGYITEYQLRIALTDKYGIPQSHIINFNYNLDVLKLINLVMIKDMKIIPLALNDNTLIIAADYFIDNYKIKRIQDFTSKVIKQILIEPKEMEFELSKVVNILLN